MTIEIGGVPVGPGQPVYVIAEAGSNHNDSLDTAYQLIDAAAQAGANMCKFQLFRADELYPGTITEHAIPDDWLPNLKAHCHIQGIEFLCSVFSTETLHAYLQVEPAAVKIASPEATNLDLLGEAAGTGLPLIVSTGAMDWLTLDRTVEALWAADVILLHCVAAYPAPPSHLNLAAITAMADRYGLPVGFSDHTLDQTVAPSVAVAAGACMIEKHLTLDRDQPGPDHPFALEPDEFKTMVHAVRLAQVMLGDGEKQVMPSEDPTDRRRNTYLDHPFTPGPLLPWYYGGHCGICDRPTWEHEPVAGAA